MMEPVAMDKTVKAEEEKWQAEDDVRTLVRAAEIRADSKRLARAKKMAKEQLAALKGV